MAQRKGQTCVLFTNQPEGTTYKEGAYSWVETSTAKQYIEKGYGTEYDPVTKQPQELPEAQPEGGYPSDFPEAIKNICLEDGKDFDEVEQLYGDEDLQSINGVGESTETKIKNYFD